MINRIEIVLRIKKPHFIERELKALFKNRR